MKKSRDCPRVFRVAMMTSGRNSNAVMAPLTSWMKMLPIAFGSLEKIAKIARITQLSRVTIYRVLEQYEEGLAEIEVVS